MYFSADLGADPNEFKSTAQMLKQTRISFNSNNAPGLSFFIAALKINGANFYNNQMFTSKVIVSLSVTPAAKQVLSEEPGVFEKIKELIRKN